MKLSENSYKSFKEHINYSIILNELGLFVESKGENVISRDNNTNLYFKNEEVTHG